MTIYSVVEFFNRQKREIDKIIDKTFFRLLEGTAAIDKLVPRISYPDRSLLILKMQNHRPTVASLVAEEQEIPASRPRAQITEDLLGNCKIGKQIIWKARDYEMMQKMQSAAAGMGSRGAQVVKELEKHYFGQAADLVPSVNEKAIILTLKIATTGACIFVDPLSTARVELTYPDTIADHLPDPLVGPARWSQPLTCTPLTNLETHARVIYDHLGMWMPILVLHFINLRQVADSNEAKITKLRNAGADSANPDLTGVYIKDEEAIALILERTRAKEVIIFDGQYSEESANGTITDKYFLDEDYYFFGSEGYLEQAFVPTVEKDFQQGVYFNSRVINDAPRVERSVAVGNMIPAAFDPRRIAARKVN